MHDVLWLKQYESKEETGLLRYQCTWYSLREYFIDVYFLDNLLISKETSFKMFILQRKVCDISFSLQMCQVDHNCPLWPGI